MIEKVKQRERYFDYDFFGWRKLLRREAENNRTDTERCHLNIKRKDMTCLVLHVNVPNIDSVSST